MLAVKHVGAGAAVREALRRVFGMQYAYRGIPVRDAATFRTLRLLASKGWDVWAEGGYAYARGRLGTFAVPAGEAHLLWPLAAGEHEIYGCLDVRGRVVADVGAYLGETAVLFARMGAKFVHAYEPVFYELAELNLRLNGITSAAIHPYGLWLEGGWLDVDPAGAATGLRRGSARIEVRPITEALELADVVKMDCEGCEWALLALPCGAIRRVEEYAIEIHGPEPYIVARMEQCGYAARKIADTAPMVTAWHFTRR